MSMISSELLVKLAVSKSDRVWGNAELVGHQSRDAPLSDKHVVLFRKIKIKY